MAPERLAKSKLAKCHWLQYGSVSAGDRLCWSQLYQDTWFVFQLQQPTSLAQKKKRSKSLISVCSVIKLSSFFFIVAFFLPSLLSFYLLLLFLVLCEVKLKRSEKVVFFCVGVCFLQQFHLHSKQSIDGNISSLSWEISAKIISLKSYKSPEIANVIVERNCSSIIGLQFRAKCFSGCQFTINSSTTLWAFCP